MSWTLEQWAPQVGASARTLARLLRRELGMSFSAWPADAAGARASVDGAPQRGSGEHQRGHRGLVRVAAQRHPDQGQHGEKFKRGPARHVRARSLIRDGPA